MVIYGAGSNLENTLRVMNLSQEYLLCDKRYNEINEAGSVEICNPELLNNQKEKFYVLISIYKEYPEIREQLERYGYQSEKDFCYLSIDVDAAMEEKPENYTDIYGNKIVGDLNGAKVKFLGRDALIKVAEGFSGKDLTIEMASDALLEIGEGVKVISRNQWKLADGTKLSVGEKCRWRTFGGEVVLTGERAECIIEKGVTLGEDNKFIVAPNTKLRIGKNSMFSRCITIRTNDGHPIYDLVSKQCTNYTNEARQVIIHDHVWVGEGCMILYNTEIGSGSIVGAKSLVKGKFPNNCILAGHMAKVIRENVAWSHNMLSGGLEELNEEWRQMTTYE